MVSEVPPQVLGTVQDAWFREGIDMGMPVPPLGGWLRTIHERARQEQTGTAIIIVLDGTLNEGYDFCAC